MSSAAMQISTYEELLRQIEELPEGSTGEILGPGWLRVMSRPGRKHRDVHLKLLFLLRDRGLVPGGGWIIQVEAEVELLDRLYVPDLVGWRVEPEEGTDFLDENPIQRCPDWACEIFSRSTQAADRVYKLPTYARAGVGHVWVIDPVTQTVEVYESRGGLAALVATGSGTDVVDLPPFPGSFSLSTFWER